MAEILLAMAVFVLAVAGMSIGVIMRNKSIKGSCGGLANLRDEQGRSMCEACTNPSPDCTGENAEPASGNRFSTTSIIQSESALEESTAK